MLAAHAREHGVPAGQALHAQVPARPQVLCITGDDDAADGLETSVPGFVTGLDADSPGSVFWKHQVVEAISIYICHDVWTTYGCAVGVGQLPEELARHELARPDPAVRVPGADPGAASGQQQHLFAVGMSQVHEREGGHVRRQVDGSSRDRGDGGAVGGAQVDGHPATGRLLRAGDQDDQVLQAVPVDVVEHTILELVSFRRCQGADDVGGFLGGGEAAQQDAGERPHGVLSSTSCS